MEPPKDIKKQGKLWKLKKPLYGLNDASRKFWLKVREIFAQEAFDDYRGDEMAPGVDVQSDNDLDEFIRF